MIQKTSLRVILGDMYVSYTAALDMCGLQTLAERRQRRCLDFALKCVENPKMERIFPLNQKTKAPDLRQKEKFKVNFASTTAYKNSAVPYCQRFLNQYYSGEV